MRRSPLSDDVDLDRAHESAAGQAPAEGEDPALYAVIVVQTPLQRRITGSEPSYDVAEEDSGGQDSYLTRAFHYSVPGPLRTQIRLGQLVWVPFGKRSLQGIVVRFDDASPVENTRDVAQIVDLEPVFSDLQLSLADWMSRYYLAPIDTVVRAMLPPGVTQVVDIVVNAVPQDTPETVTKGQDELLSLLRAKGPLTLRQIARASKRRDYRAIIDQLVRHGWATKEATIRPPKVKPKLVSVVRIRDGPEPSSWPSGRAVRQRQLLNHLMDRDDRGREWIPLADAAQKADVSTSVVRALVEKGVLEKEERHVWRDPLGDRSFVPVVPPTLTPEQAAAWAEVSSDLGSPEGRPFLLQGVTASGKTEIYLRAVGKVLAQGRGAIILVPEIALTPQTIRRFGARFPSTLAVMHSRLSDGERYDQWLRLRAGELRLVVGSRSALFAPIRDLGLIVLDEEHEPSYKQDRTPNYHARDLAVELARISGATCILGSATPDLASRYRAERGEYGHLLLPKRVMGHRRIVADQARKLQTTTARFRPVPDGPGDPGGLGEAMYAALPPVEVVDMRAELRAGNTSIFSRSLKRGIEVALAAGQQIILFLNRRGSATFVMCRDCGHVIQCPRCDLPLTYHSAVDDLICHHCNHTTFLPPQCPSCWSGRIKFFGVGTQRIEELVRETYPRAVVVRWDLDTTGGRRSAHEEILDKFISGEADIMVGTQMIAKGLDLPRVTLVGVITADTMINLPDYRAGERSFQLLTQVAGRAGRSILGGRVVIQTYTPHHPAVQLASHHDYESFYRQELTFRRRHWYPPVSRLLKLVYVHASSDQARRQAERLYRMLTLKIARLGLPEVNLVGPAPAFFARLRGKYRWQILVRGTDPTQLVRDMRLPLGWRVDVDPVSVL